MKRTSIMMPEALERKIKRAARSRGISFSELMRQAAEAEVGRGDDPFFDQPLRFDDEGPADASERTEKYRRRAE